MWLHTHIEKLHYLKSTDGTLFRLFILSFSRYKFTKRLYKKITRGNWRCLQWCSSLQPQRVHNDEKQIIRTDLETQFSDHKFLLQDPLLNIHTIFMIRSLCYANYTKFPPKPFKASYKFVHNFKKRQSRHKYVFIFCPKIASWFCSIGHAGQPSNK